MKTIVWDVDDVLNNLMQTWFENYWLPLHPKCPITYYEISENPPHRLLGVSKSEYLASLDEFRLSEIARQMMPVTEVLAWFHQYGDRFRHIALTATALCAASSSASWVMHHFGKWIRTFHLIPSPREGEKIPIYDHSKVDFLRWWGRGDILIDDSPSNVSAAEALGIKALLIPRPWNRNSQTISQTLGILTKLVQ